MVYPLFRDREHHSEPVEPVAATAEVTVVLRVTSDAAQAPDLTARLIGALRDVVDLPAADLRITTQAGPVDRVAPASDRPLRIMVASRRVLHRGEPVELTRLEFDLLLFLCRRPNQVHQRAVLMNHVWGTGQFASPRTVDVHVRRIRLKLRADRPLIATVRGVGYRITDTDYISVEPDA